MATFAFSTTAFPQGAIFVFGSWVCIANGSGGFDSHLANLTALEAISSENCYKNAGSDDHGVTLLPDLAKQIESKLEDNSGSAQTQFDLIPNSTRIETLLAQPIYGLRSASSTYQQMIKSICEDSLDQTLSVENFPATTSRGTLVFDVYSNIDESSHDSLDFITKALAKFQLKSCQDFSLTELLDNLREVASIDDLPFQHGTPLTPTRETGSEGTELADYGSDLESYTPECLVSVINLQLGGAPSQHDPNEIVDQISDDDLTQDAPQDEDDATCTARRARNQRRGERRAHATQRARLPPCNLN